MQLIVINNSLPLFLLLFIYLVNQDNFVNCNFFLLSKKNFEIAKIYD
jgi:hypothetical protein